jgi:nitrate reductase (NAD(P)H)
LMGMMNNGWYKVVASTQSDGKLSFRHPFHQEDAEGWMKPSTENQLEAAKQDSGVPDKQFTREEIEKHNTKDDCWLVINGNVYDSTSVLSWHPGGSATLLTNAGKLSQDVMSQFESIHDSYAHKKLSECVIGRVTDKAMTFMKEQAKAEAEEEAKSGPSDTLLQSKKWVPVELVDREKISEDTYIYTFSYKDVPGKRKLGLGTCQHIQFGIHMLDKMLIRSYTPTRPITSKDDDGTFELTVKTYYPDENQPGGAFSNFLLELPIGESVDVCGPTGEIEYLGSGRFDIEGQERTFTQISLVLGGSGITPGYALVERIFRENDDKVKVKIIDANKTEDDILLREKLNELEEKSKGRVSITHVLSHPKDKAEWEKKGGLSGHVNAGIIKARLFAPEEESVVLLCGPPGMIQKAALPALKGESSNHLSSST